MREASFYALQEGGKVKCALCAHRCLIAPGSRGLCGVRENRGGTLVSLVYGRLVSAAVDPIEKKPLFHYLPGSLSYSIATAGCNFSCRFCQNHAISQPPRETGEVFGRDTPPAVVVSEALQSACASISYTYVEPTVFMEYALDVATLARAEGLGNVFVTNGYMTGEALDILAPVLDAANVDLKAFRNEFYKKLCGAKLAPVLSSLEKMKRAGIWVEVTTLVIPGENDDPGELAELAAFVHSLGADTPWHVSGFHPTYLLTDRPPTPASTLLRAREIGLAAGLRHVYVGNIRGAGGEDTLCHDCGATLIERIGYATRQVGLVGSRCRACNTPMDGRFAAEGKALESQPKGRR